MAYYQERVKKGENHVRGDVLDLCDMSGAPLYERSKTGAICRAK